MVKSRLRILVTLFALLGVILPAPSSQAVTQKINYYMNGDCTDYYDEEGIYAFFQSEPDWSCYISVKVAPVKPVRSVTLQWWNGKKWLTEDKKVTNAKGMAYLYFDAYCDGEYCDGEWKYRVLVAAATGQKAATSSTFYVTFFPDDTPYSDSEEDPNY